MDGTFALELPNYQKEKRGIMKRIERLSDIAKQIEPIAGFFNDILGDCMEIVTKHDSNWNGGSWEKVTRPPPATKSIRKHLLKWLTKEGEYSCNQVTRAINEEAAYEIGNVSFHITSMLLSLQRFWHGWEENDLTSLAAQLQRRIDDTQYSYACTLGQRIRAQQYYERAAGAVRELEVVFFNKIKKCLSSEWDRLRYNNMEARRCSALPTGREEANQSFDEWVQWSVALTMSEFVDRADRHMSKISKWTAYFLCQGVGASLDDDTPVPGELSDHEDEEDEDEESDNSGGSSQASENSADEEEDED